jgi:group II intron reverse transcriptase/maturase
MNVSTKQEWIATWARENPQRVFTSLHHLIDEEWMREAYRLTRKDGAAGIDRITAEDYEQNLEENLKSLLRRFKDGSYRALPVRRTYIPKGKSDRRPLGIPAFEDKILQRAVLMLLEPLYEQDFHPVSFGYRPKRSAHQALDALNNQIMRARGHWLIEVDIRKYFDTVNHQQLRAFLDLRVKDGVIRRTIDKWLKAGVMEGGQITRSPVGTPQGSVISPLMANIYLHYVLDEWFQKDVKPRMKGRCNLTRFVDDFVLAFEQEDDCRRVYQVLEKRFAKYGLALHPEKTRIIDFRFKPSKQHRHAGQAFDFLGFTHVWGRSRRGKRMTIRRTAKSRIARTLQKISMVCKRERHKPLEEQHRKLNHILGGHYAYFGITGNFPSMGRVRHRAARIWQKWLSRRSRRSRTNWEAFNLLLKRFPLRNPKIYHSYMVKEQSL